MFNFLKARTSILNSELLDGFTDLHCHVLPGVDDGMKSVNEALEALEFYAGSGVRRVCMTPHIMEDMSSNNYSYLSEAFRAFQEKYTGSVELVLGAEYMMDMAFKNHLAGETLTFPGKHILMETSYMNPPVEMDALLYDTSADGYRIILAHPERYVYMDHPWYYSLHDRGVFFQLNLLSLTGAYGKRAQANAEYLLDKDLYTFVGSDMHKLAFHQKEFKKSWIKKKHMKKILLLKENNDRLFSDHR